MTTQTNPINELFRSHVDFLLAEFRNDATLPGRAADVLVWRDGRFLSVRDLVDACASHRWNTMIYEAWVWETAHRVRALTRTLDRTYHATVARAVTIHAQHLGYDQMDDHAMRASLEAARRALDGEPFEEGLASADTVEQSPSTSADSGPHVDEVA